MVWDISHRLFFNYFGFSLILKWFNIGQENTYICIRILQIKIVSIISLHQQKNDLHKMFKKEVIGVLLLHIVNVPFIVLMVRAGYQRHLYTASIRQRSNGEKIRVTQCCE